MSRTGSQIQRARSLSTAKNVALICASIAIVVSSSVDIYSRLRVPERTPPATPRPAPAAFRPGMKAPAVPGLDYATSDRTLVLFLSTKCKYCEMSVPFYRELIGKVAAGNPRRRVVAVFPQGADDVNRFKAREKLEIDSVVDTVLGEVGVSGTPTLLLVAKDGTVIRGWVGAPTPQVKDAIMAALVQG